MIFQLNNELIPSIDVTKNSTKSETLFIMLNSHDKYKLLKIESLSRSNDAKFLKDEVFLATSFKNLIMILAATLRDSRNSVISIILPAFTIILDNYEYYIDKIKTKLKNKMREIWSIIRRIL